MKFRVGLVLIIVSGLLALVFAARERRAEPGSGAVRPAAGGSARPAAVPVVAAGSIATERPVAVQTAVATNAPLLMVAPARPQLESWPEVVQIRVKRFEDAAVPVEEREAELAALAKAGDDNAATVLMALGNEHTYLNYAAIQALAGVQSPVVSVYLQGKLEDADPRIVASAARSLAGREGAAAVPAIAAAIRKNRQRADGFQDMVCAACAAALGETRSAQAVPVLDAELRETVGFTLQYEYGSKVIKALVATGQTGACEVIRAYAERLSRGLPEKADNPMGKRYMEDKIREARDAAASIGKVP